MSSTPERRSADSRVVVTGVGLVSPLGTDVGTTFAAMSEGRSGIGRITRFDPTGLPCEIAGEVDADALEADADGEARGSSAWRLLRAAAREAGAFEALDGLSDRTRASVILGGHAAMPENAQIETVSRYSDAQGNVDFVGLAADGPWDVNRATVRSPDVTPALLAHALDAQGMVFPIVSACAAGTQAIGESARLLRSGRADVVVTGGVEPLINYGYFVGFALLGALTRKHRSPETASRPFDRSRNGFVMAEGCGVLVLETLAAARRRDRPVLGEILGYGDSADGFRITEMPPDGAGAVRAMRRALDDACINPEQVEYINAHGTSTPLNDPSETAAIKEALGEHARRLPVSSNKSMIGHTIGAAGAIEAILTLRGMQEGVLLPTINLDSPDRRCDLDYVPHQARSMRHGIALSNSFGFGGQNGCLCLGAAG